MLNFSLSPEQLKLQKKAREFALKEILPVAWYYDEIDDTPLPVLKKAYEAGLINADIPTEYGGKGYGLIENVILTEEFAAACPGLATSIFDNSLGMEPLRLSKNDRLKEKYFRLKSCCGMPACSESMKEPARYSATLFPVMR